MITLIVRLDAEHEALIKAAADRHSQPMAEFMIEATLAAIEAHAAVDGDPVKLPALPPLDVIATVIADLFVADTGRLRPQQAEMVELLRRHARLRR